MAKAKRTITGGIAAGIRTFTEYLERWLERSGKIHQKMQAKGTAMQMDIVSPFTFHFSSKIGTPLVILKGNQGCYICIAFHF